MPKIYLRTTPLRWQGDNKTDTVAATEPPFALKATVDDKHENTKQDLPVVVHEARAASKRSKQATRHRTLNTRMTQVQNPMLA